MKTILSTAVTALALLGLAGCSADPAAPSPAPGTQPAGSAAPAPTGGSAAPAPAPGTAPTKSQAPHVAVQPDGKVDVPAGYKELPAAQVDVKALPDTYKERRVWSSADGKSLQLVAVARDACAGIDAQVSQATDTSVTVSLSPMTSPQGGPEGGKVCATVLTPRAVELALEQPIGTRTVVVTENAG
ncbi:hypothetical protein V5P93_005999 [Actinokineospora auranticolor]|uniref:Uncharacterized protein n=1 Tax=Actinokineospora auranticolor TaxID=155976 RepID=A0A2S6GC58_9PSEU|nr:hypothetical protein [Actinokineospora auranticolor]PPK62190.1 hypothetical protein CLV40_1361 [Actinokineospora auranticolor]